MQILVWGDKTKAILEVLRRTCTYVWLDNCCSCGFNLQLWFMLNERIIRCMMCDNVITPCNNVVHGQSRLVNSHWGTVCIVRVTLLINLHWVSLPTWFITSIGGLAWLIRVGGDLTHSKGDSTWLIRIGGSLPTWLHYFHGWFHLVNPHWGTTLLDVCLWFRLVNPHWGTICILGVILPS